MARRKSRIQRRFLAVRGGCPVTHLRTRIGVRGPDDRRPAGRDIACGYAADRGKTTGCGEGGVGARCGIAVGIHRLNSKVVQSSWSQTCEAHLVGGNHRTVSRCAYAVGGGSAVVDRRIGSLTRCPTDLEPGSGRVACLQTGNGQRFLSWCRRLIAH